MKFQKARSEFLQSNKLLIIYVNPHLNLAGNQFTSFALKKALHYPMSMKRYFKNRFGQMIELDINYNYLKGELQRVNIFLLRKGTQEFLHTLFFTNDISLDHYRLVELSDSNKEINISDAWLDQPFYLFCSPSEIEEFKMHYPRVLTLREDVAPSDAAFMA